MRNASFHCLAGALRKRTRGSRLCYGNDIRFATCAFASLVMMSAASFAQLAFVPSDTDPILRQLDTFYQAGNHHASLAEAQKYEAALKARFGTSHANYAVALSNAAVVYLALGDSARAETLERQALTIREKALGNHPAVAKSLFNLVNLYWSQGKYEEASEVCERAHRITDKPLGPAADVPRILSDLMGPENLREGIGRLKCVNWQLEKLTVGKNLSQLADLLLSIAADEEKQALYAEAEGTYKRALAIREKAVGINDPSVAAVLFALADLYRRQGRHGEAEAVRTRATTVQGMSR